MAVDATGSVTSPDSIPTYNTAVDNPSGKGLNNIVAALQTALSARLLKSIWTTAGDILYASGASTPTRLGIGSVGQVLTPVAGVPSWSTPPGYEYDYAPIIAPVNITAVAFASATTLITGNSVTYDGSTAVWVEVFAPHVNTPASTAAAFLNIWDGATDLGIIAKVNSSTGGVDEAPLLAKRKLTPSAGAHTFSIRGTMNSGTGVFSAGPGGTGGTELPAFIRITKA